MTTCNDRASSGDVVLVDTYRGDTVRLQVELFSATGTVDISGWLWLSQVRDATDAVVATMSTVLLDVDKGVLELGLSDEQTAAMEGDYRFDLQATDANDDVRTLFEGKIRVRPDVSRT
jgi:hypothetical protein